MSEHTVKKVYYFFPLPLAWLPGPKNGIQGPQNKKGLGQAVAHSLIDKIVKINYLHGPIQVGGNTTRFSLY